MPTLLRQDHGGAALAVAHVDALGVRHQKEVHHGALAHVVESEVEGQHALVVLADRSARVGEEQRGTLWWDPVPEANCKGCKWIKRFDKRYLEA